MAFFYRTKCIAAPPGFNEWYPTTRASACNGRRLRHRINHVAEPNGLRCLAQPGMRLGIASSFTLAHFSKNRCARCRATSGALPPARLLMTTLMCTL